MARQPSPAQSAPTSWCSVAAGTYDLSIEQGATYRLSARFGSLLVDGDGDPVLDADGNQQIDEGRDFTGCTFRAQLRKGKSTESTAMVTVTSEDVDGGITADDDGNLEIVMPDELTDAVTRSGYWDLKCYNSDGTEDRLLEGTVTVDRAVTEDEA